MSSQLGRAAQLIITGDRYLFIDAGEKLWVKCAWTTDWPPGWRGDFISWDLCPWESWLPCCFSGEWDQLPLLPLMLQLGHIFRQSPATQVSARGEPCQVWHTCGCVFWAKVTDPWYKPSTLITKVESPRGGQMLLFPINMSLVSVPSDCRLSLFCSDHWTLCVNPSSEQVACVVHYEGVSTVAWSRPHYVYAMLEVELIPDGKRTLILRQPWTLSVDGPWGRVMV